MNTVGIKVKLLGLGGAGVHIVNAFDQKSSGLVECHVLDTDAKALATMQSVRLTPYRKGSVSWTW